jgi:WD40 repeat protein
MYKPILLLIVSLFTFGRTPISGQETSADTENPLVLISTDNASQVEQQTVLLGNTSWMLDLAFSPDGTVLAVAETASPYLDFENVQGKVRIWNSLTWKEEASLNSDGLSAMSLDFDSKGNYLAVGNSTGEIQIWHLNSQRIEATLTGHTTWVNSLAFDPSNSLLVSGSGYLFGSRGDYTVRLWLTGDWEPFYTLTPENAEWGAGLGVAYNPIGTIIAAGMTNGTVHLWDGELKDEIAVLDGYAWAHDLIFTPDSAQILFAANDGVRVWNIAHAIETFGYIPEYKLVAPLQEQEFIFSLALNADGTVLAVGYHDGTVRLWNMDTGEQLTVLEGHEGRVVSLAFSPDGTLLASGGTDGTVRLWGVSPGE